MSKGRSARSRKSQQTRSSVVTMHCSPQLAAAISLAAQTEGKPVSVWCQQIIGAKLVEMNLLNSSDIRLTTSSADKAAKRRRLKKSSWLMRYPFYRGVQSQNIEYLSEMSGIPLDRLHVLADKDACVDPTDEEIEAVAEAMLLTRDFVINSVRIQQGQRESNAD